MPKMSDIGEKNDQNLTTFSIAMTFLVQNLGNAKVFLMNGLPLVNLLWPVIYQ